MDCCGESDDKLQRLSKRVDLPLVIPIHKKTDGACVAYNLRDFNLYKGYRWVTTAFPIDAVLHQLKSIFANTGTAGM